jgi:hypothetical protein
MIVLIFHLVLSSFTFDGVDVTMAQKVLDWNLKRYPNGDPFVKPFLHALTVLQVFFSYSVLVVFLWFAVSPAKLLNVICKQRMLKISIAT